MTEDNQIRRETVARNLRTARENRAISIGRLAREAEIDVRTVRGYVGGYHMPDTPNLIKLAAVLGQPLEWFFADHDDSRPDDAA